MPQEAPAGHKGTTPLSLNLDAR